MKYTYKFNTEEVEIEVDEKWGNIILELDRQEYNDNHRETRRHCSLDLYSREGCEIPSKSNVLLEILHAEDIDNLYKSLPKLEPRQRRLIEQHFFCGISQTEIAEQEDISAQAVHQSIDRALKKLKKFFD